MHVLGQKYCRQPSQIETSADVEFLHRIRCTAGLMRYMTVGGSMRSKVQHIWRGRFNSTWSCAPCRRYGGVARRGYAEHAADRRGGEAADRRQRLGMEVVMGTISTEHAPGSSMEQLLASIRPPALAEGGAGSGQQPTLLALLLTPSYARHGLDSDLALRLLARVQQRPFAPTLDVLTAVVDRMVCCLP